MKLRMTDALRFMCDQYGMDYAAVVDDVERACFAAASTCSLQAQAYCMETTDASHRFQIIGIDVMFDASNGPPRAVVLEVNAHPSLRIDHEFEVQPGVFEQLPSEIDSAIKVPLVRDTLTAAHERLTKGKSPEQACDGLCIKLLQYGEEETFPVLNEFHSLLHVYKRLCCRKPFMSSSQFARLIRTLPSTADIPTPNIDLLFIKATHNDLYCFASSDRGSSRAPPEKRMMRFWEFVGAILLICRSKLTTKIDAESLSAQFTIIVGQALSSAVV